VSDYRIKVSVRNARILRAIEEMGYESVKKFCEAEGLGYSAVGNLVAMRRPPINTDGEFSECAALLMAATCKLPQELWTPEQMTALLPHNTYERDVSTLDMIAEVEHGRVLSQLLDRSGISDRDRRVLENSFSKDMAQRETAEQEGLCTGRINQLEWKALKKLRRTARKMGMDKDTEWMEG
jgi:hypothetical protein